MAKASTKTDVAPVKESGHNLVSQEDFAAFAGMPTGFENVTARDILIPRLTILQGLSPQVTQGKPEFDPEAKVGNIYDTAMMQIFANGIIFLPVYFSEQWLEWAPRNSGKGLQGIHDSPAILEQTEKDEKGRNILKSGNYIMETYQLYGYNVSANFRKSFIPFVSTQRKKCKRIITLGQNEKIEIGGRQITPPMFYRSYALTTVPESNAEGNWMGWKVEPGQPTTELRPDWREFLADDVKPFIESLVSGGIKGDIASMQDEHTGPTIDADAPM